MPSPYYEAKKSVLRLIWFLQALRAINVNTSLEDDRGVANRLGARYWN